MRERVMSQGGAGWGRGLLLALLLVGCDASKPVDSLPDAGVQGDAGTDGGVVTEAPPCEKTLGLCAGAKRALLAGGGYEPVCTALSYGSAYEESETRCDGLDNDCDGVTDPDTWADVVPLAEPPTGDMVDSLPVEGGFLVVVSDRYGQVQVLRLDSALSLKETTVIPVPTGPSPVPRIQWVRTSAGPALFYTVWDVPGSSVRPWLRQLDEQGVPTSQGEGVPLSEPSGSFTPSHLMMSAGGTRGLLMGSRLAEPDIPHVLQGVLVDGAGQPVAGVQTLIQLEDSRTVLSGLDALALDDGGFLVLTVEAPRLSNGSSRIWLQRLDADLSLVGAPRIIPAGDVPIPKLVMSTLQGPTREPLLLFRDRTPDVNGLMRVASLFDGGAPEELASMTTSFDVPWFGATATSQGLQTAWLAVQYVARPNQDPFNAWEGRFWTRGLSGTVAERTPGTAPMPLNRHSQWVLMNELPGQWMGAFVMTNTGDSLSRTLRSVRYCAP
jgi:hypothetical protein